MNTQPEAILEENLIRQLTGLDYSYASIHDEESLLANLKTQLEDFNKTTLLINGLPLVQIELKRRGLELKEAFNQINRYQRHSFWTNSGLFQYVQIPVTTHTIINRP